MISFKKIQPLIFAILFATIIGVVLAGFWYLLERQGETLREQMQAIADREASDAKSQELRELVAATLAQREELQEYILQDDGETIALLSELDRIADSFFVELVTQKLDVVETKEEFNVLQLSYHLEGSEEAVEQMILLFETLPYHGHLTEVSMTRPAAEDEEQEVRASVAMELSIKKYDQ